MKRMPSLKLFAGLVLVAVASGLVLGVSYSVKSDSHSSSAGASEGLGTEILYLGPLGDDPSSSVDASRFEALGATTVSSFADLRSATTDGAKAILIHRDHIGTLSSSDIDWASASFRDGVILGGINISVEELSAAFGLRSDLDAQDIGVQHYFEYAPDRTFYAFVYKMQSPTGGSCVGAGSDYLDKGREVNDAGVKVLLDKLAARECPAPPKDIPTPQSS